MNWWQIVLTVYFVLNFIIAILSMIKFEKLGYYGGWKGRVVIFLLMLFGGTPITIPVLVKWVKDTFWSMEQKSKSG